VEGSDDGRLYRRFIDRTKCQLIVGLNKQNVISAIHLLDADNFAGALGLVDSDFDALDGTPVHSTNILRSECHDLEALLVRSPALEAVLHEFASQEKLERFENNYGNNLRNWIVATARPLGYLRWYSARRGLNLRFEGLHFSRFVNARTLKLDNAGLRAEIKNQSQNHAISEDELHTAGWPTKQNEDAWQVCCGHDLVELLTLALRRCIGSRQGLTTEDVAQGLRLAFSEQHFAVSELRASIARWESQSGFHILLP